MGTYCNFVCDLHGHTNRSDGNDTPYEFLLHAAERKMKIVAITDHDKVPPSFVEVNGEQKEIVSFAADLGLKLLEGTEISCETDIEEVHLVCFGCDWEDPFFRELDDFTVQSKVKSYRVLTERLTEMGMPISWEEVLQNNGNPIRETEVQKKMIFNLMAQKGYTKDWSEAKQLVKKTEKLQIMREKPEASEVIHTVHRQGGIVIMAHPYLVSEEVTYHGRKMSRDDFIDALLFEGLDGIEARYTYDKTSYGGTLTPQEIYKEVMEKYSGRIPIISGGSDYHGEGKKAVKNPREIGECGLTESEFYGNPILRRLVNGQE